MSRLIQNVAGPAPGIVSRIQGDEIWRPLRYAKTKILGLHGKSVGASLWMKILWM